MGPTMVNWTADSASIRLALMNSSFSIATNQSQTSGEYWSDVSAMEIAAGGAPTNYTAATNAGKTLGANTYTVTTGSGKIVVLAPAGASPSVVWTTPTFSTYGAVIFKDTGTASTSPLIAFLDFGGVQSPAAGDFTVTWNASGIATITVA
jgi:hypothetical protein